MQLLNSMCTRNFVLLGIYTAACYLIVKSDVCSLVPDILIPFRGLPTACIRRLPGEYLIATFFAVTNFSEF